MRESIDSDTEGLVTLLGATVSAESRYFELNQRMIETSRETWAQECDYTRELKNLRTYAALLEADGEAALLREHFELRHGQSGFRAASTGPLATAGSSGCI